MSAPNVGFSLVVWSTAPTKVIYYFILSFLDMSESSRRGDGADSSTPRRSPPSFSSSSPPVGSHEEPCGKCLSLLVKYWEDRMRAEEQEWPSSSFEHTSSYPARRTVLEVSAHSSAPVLRSTPAAASPPTSAPVLRSCPHNTPFPSRSPTSNTPFSSSISSQPGLADTPSWVDRNTKKPKVETVSHRRKARRKMRSLPYNIALKADPGTSQESRNSKPPSDRSPLSAPNASTPTRPPSESREDAAPWKITIPAALTQLTIPEMLDKLKGIEVPQIGIPDLPAIPPLTLPDVPHIPLPELPKLALPKIPTFNLPELPRIELPKISLQDFPQIFNMRLRSQSAPVFSYSCRSQEEYEAANSSTPVNSSTDSPGVESCEWRE